MVLKMYTIRDSKGEVYNNPFLKHTHGEAERDFAALLKDERSMVKQFPEDFDLYYLGTFDNQKGTFDGLDTPQHICKAITLVK